MKRREYILGLTMFAAVRRAGAQGRARSVGARLAEQVQADILETVLRQKGWIFGQNLRVENRIAHGDTNLSRAHARDLLALQPDVLFAVSNTSMAALHAEHSRIPTVFAMVSNPVEVHYIKC
jgi:putative ABC transport system substrate-binding protein